MSRFEEWRQHKLQHPENIRLVYRRFLLWWLSNDANQKWWITTNSTFIVNTVIFVLLIVVFAVCYYMGIVTLGTSWLGNAFTMRYGKKSVCGQSLRVKHNVYDLRQLIDVATWEATFESPYRNISTREMRQGYLSLEYPNHITEVNVDLGDLSKELLRLSMNGTCVCAADLFIPYNIFAFDSRVFWHVSQWTMTPHGHLGKCWGETVSMEHAKGYVEKPCGEKHDLVIFKKGALCCMEFCLKSKGIFS